MAAPVRDGGPACPTYSGFEMELGTGRGGEIIAGRMPLMLRVYGE